MRNFNHMKFDFKQRSEIACIKENVEEESLGTRRYVYSMGTQTGTDYATCIYASQQHVHNYVDIDEHSTMGIANIQAHLDALYQALRVLHFCAL